MSNTEFNLLPNFYFPHKGDEESALKKKYLQKKGYFASYDLPRRWGVHILTFAKIFYREDNETDYHVVIDNTPPRDYDDILCIAALRSPLEVNEYTVMENFFSHLFNEKEFGFPRFHGLLEYYVNPEKQKELAKNILPVEHPVTPNSQEVVNQKEKEE